MINGKPGEFVNYNDKLYRIYRRISKDRIKEGFISNVKEAWHCDIVLKNKNQEEEILMFLIEIPDAIIIDPSTVAPTPAAIISE